MVAGPAARELAVEASFAGGASGELRVHDGAAPFVRDVRVLDDGSWRRVEPTGAAWIVPSCATECRVRYRFFLGEAAASLADVDSAVAVDGLLEAPPSTWLLHPVDAPAGGRFRLRVATPPGVAFVTGLYPAGGDDVFEAAAGYLAVAPYSAFGALRTVQAEGASNLTIALPPSLDESKEAMIGAWVRDASRAVSTYFGCMPVPRVLVIVMPIDGSLVMRGHALGDGGAAIVVEMGREANAATLESDWILTHEMVHMAFPSVSQRQHWMEEGVAVYVEPIARLRSGAAAPEDVWRKLANGLPKGAPRAHDRGLDDTRSWGRTYWGGALYCLLADVAIRQRTNDKYSLEDALRGIIADGGNIGVVWEFDRVLETGDRAVGVPVLRELYARLGERPETVDVDALLKSLGVLVHGDHVTFDDAAPLAAIRRSITSGESAAALARGSACPSSDRVTRVAGALGTSKGAGQN